MKLRTARKIIKRIGLTQHCPYRVGQVRRADRRLARTATQKHTEALFWGLVRLLERGGAGKEKVA